MTEEIAIPPDATAQDTLDGYSIRKLRESLPRRWTFTVEESDLEGTEFYIYAYEPGAALGVPHWESGISRDGVTIAETADEVREAIELQQR